jgi:hypothetical protein
MDKFNFNELMEEYIIPASSFSLEAWITGDLVTLSSLIDAELQKRHDEESLSDYEKWCFEKSL